MSTKTVKMETKVAVAEGFYNGKRQRRGDTFSAPADEKSKWFASAGTKPAEEALKGEPNVLDLTPTEVKAKLPSMTSQEINEAISAEQGSKARKNVLKLMQDELANRVGQIGGPDPAAKDPNEKDPLIPGGDEPGDELLK